MITTFIHSRSSLENHSRLQTKMGKVYTRFQTKTAQQPYPTGRHIPKGLLPPPPGGGVILSLRNSVSKVLQRGASCDSYGGGIWTLLLFPGAGGGGTPIILYGLYGDVPLYRVWVFTSLSETGIL